MESNGVIEVRLMFLHTAQSIAWKIFFTFISQKRVFTNNKPDPGIIEEEERHCWGETKMSHNHEMKHLGWGNKKERRKTLLKNKSSNDYLFSTHVTQLRSYKSILFVQKATLYLHIKVPMRSLQICGSLICLLTVNWRSETTTRRLTEWF